MKHDQDALIKILARCRSASVKRLISQDTAQFSAAEIADIELEVYKNAPRGANIGKLQSALRALLAEKDPSHDSVNKAGVAHKYSTSSNPHAHGILGPEKIYGCAVQWLEHAQNGVRKVGPSENGNTSAFSLFTMFIVAAILDLEFLHPDFVPALIEALSQGNTVSLNRAMMGVSLSLRYGKQEHAEGRILIVRGATATLLRKLLSHADLRATLESIVAPWKRVDQAAILGAIDQQIVSMHPSNEWFGLTQLLNASGQVALTSLLPVIKDHRKREIVSHSLRPQVLARIQRKPAAAGMQIAFAAKYGSKGHDHAKPSEIVEPRREPEWFAELRKGLPKNEIRLDRLQCLASGLDIVGCRMGEFALYLAARLSPSSVNRYTMLIGSRIMSRPELEGCDPLLVLEEEWEDIIEKTLDEDELFRLRRYTDDSVSTKKEYSFAFLKALRYFFKFLSQRAKPLEQVNGLIPATGLVKVDANFMTVDEYKRALAWLSGPYGFSNRYLRDASRVVLILGYRCGLRRAEAAYLRLSDFDAAEFLHVRPWLLRKLKTANAVRDLPLRDMMPDDELGEVMAFIASARDRVGFSLEDVLLFSRESRPRILIDFERVIGKVHCAMRTVDPSLHYHSLRHSCANNLLLRLWPSLHPMARVIFRNHPEAIASLGDSDGFRQRLFGTLDIKGSDLQGIALLLGHGSATVSLGHYIHVLDWHSS